MSWNSTFIRVFAGALLCPFIAWVVYVRYDTETGTESTNESGQRYMPYLPSTLLPILIGVTVGFTILFGAEYAAHRTLSMCFEIFLQISAYDLALILLLPLLRRRFSARACAMLWMIPNYLYIFHVGAGEAITPKLVVTAGEWVWALFGVWLAGFIVVLGWKTAEHLAFRRRILGVSHPVTDPAILAIWEKTIKDARLQNTKFKLVTSPAVDTPLSVGLLRFATRVVLHERDYTPEELALILRHEIIHIGREDGWSKFFLVFCTAMCWLNPLMWLAREKCAEDLELSCDETALLGEGPDTRRQYAALLLDTAGDGRGFTTCLSASAKTMLHRLKNVAQPVKRSSGAVVVGITLFVLFMTTGYVALAYGDISGGEAIYPAGDPGQYTVESISLDTGSYSADNGMENEEVFHEFLSGLTLSRLTGDYGFFDSDESLTCMMNTPEGRYMVALHDDFVEVNPLFDSDQRARFYYAPEGIDWDHLRAILT